MRVGIVGTGTMGAVHAAAWRSTEARLIGCLSAQQSQSDQLAVRYGIRSYGAFTDLLEDVDIGLIEGGWAYPPASFEPASISPDRTGSSNGVRINPLLCMFFALLWPKMPAPLVSRSLGLRRIPTRSKSVTRMTRFGQENHSMLPLKMRSNRFESL
jgi:Oxidoreductase family, NAD-binding Rossmann fold